MITSALFRKPSQAQQIDKTLETVAEFLALFRLEFAHQGVLELSPVIGQAIANAGTAFGEGDAGGKFWADGLTGHQLTIEQARKAHGEGNFGEAKLGGKFHLGGASAAKLEQDGIVTRLKAPLQQGLQQRFMRELPGFDEPIKRGTG